MAQLVSGKSELGSGEGLFASQMDFSRAHVKRHSKSIKAQEVRFHYIFGRDIYMNRVGALCSRALIGRLEYCTMSNEGWVEWETLHWKPLIHYVPSISLLANRWLVFVFMEESNASLILDKLWSVLDGSLVLKK